MVRRSPGRPTIEQIESREPPAPITTCEDTGRVVCRSCGKPRLIRYGDPTKDGARHYRCTGCGQRHTLFDGQIRRI
ncbi:MAG: hypothetical protein H0W48_00440 [Methylibium sp.]|nr:hypothetical protein [Methylibium sp.]